MIEFIIDSWLMGLSLVILGSAMCLFILWVIEQLADEWQIEQVEKIVTCEQCKHCNLTAYKYNVFWCDIVSKFYVTKNEICKDFEKRVR